MLGYDGDAKARKPQNERNEIGRAMQAFKYEFSKSMTNLEGQRRVGYVRENPDPDARTPWLKWNALTETLESVYREPKGTKHEDEEGKRVLSFPGRRTQEVREAVSPRD